MAEYNFSHNFPYGGLENIKYLKAIRNQLLNIYNKIEDKKDNIRTKETVERCLKKVNKELNINTCFRKLIQFSSVVIIFILLDLIISFSLPRIKPIRDNVCNYSNGLSDFNFIGEYIGKHRLSAWVSDYLIDNCDCTDQADYIDLKGKDYSGSKAIYRIISVSRNYYWRLGSSEEVANSSGDNVIGIEEILQKNLHAKLAGLRNLVAIGVASCIGERKEEEERAQERAERIASWTNDIMLPERIEHIYLLNLGQYTQGCIEGKWMEKRQRKVFLVGIREKDNNVSIEQSFKNALHGNQKDIFYPIDVTNYSKWEKDFFLQYHR